MTDQELFIKCFTVLQNNADDCSEPKDVITVLRRELTSVEFITLSSMNFERVMKGIYLGDLFRTLESE